MNDRFSDAATDLKDAMPERWETAIEDLAQVIALGLDRAQDMAEAANEAVRTRPVVAKAAGAAVVGAIIGTILAAKTSPPPRPKIRISREAAQEASAAAATQASLVVDQAVAIARATAERLARKSPTPDEPVNGMRETRRNRQAAAPAPPREVGRVGYAAQLVPLSVELLKNPIVRDLLIAMALRAARRKG
jgi:ElaB/YqjD/DUF883 family membrane-anchored ribosome-binding protein